MSQRALPIAVVSALILSLAAQSAEARPKSFCRRWAAGVANNNVLYESQGAPADKAGPRQRAAAGKGGTAPAELDIDRLAGGGLGGTLARMGKTPRWKEVFNQAYADCRVVKN